MSPVLTVYHLTDPSNLLKRFIEFVIDMLDPGLYAKSIPILKTGVSP